MECSPIDSVNNKRLVHFSCPLSDYADFVGVEGLSDRSDFRGIRLSRLVEVYEWEEDSSTRQESDGRGGTTTITTYYYSQRWRTSHSDTSSFNEPGYCGGNTVRQECSNPDPRKQAWWGSGPGLGGNYALGNSDVKVASALKSGDFRLSDSLISMLGAPELLSPSCKGVLPDGECPTFLSVHGSFLYYRNTVGREVDMGTDSPGDVRVTYTVFNATEASVLAKQTGAATGDSLSPWESPYDKSYTMYMAEDGERSAIDMLLDAEKANAALTWLLRLLSYIMSFVGLQISLSPITTLLSTVPCFGGCFSAMAGTALCMLSCLVASTCWLLVVGASWVAFRPEIGVPLLVLAAAAFAASAWWKRYSDRVGTERVVANAQRIVIEPNSDMGDVPFLQDGHTQQVAPKFCGDCGVALRADDAFCAKCGAAAAATGADSNVTSLVTAQAKAV